MSFATRATTIAFALVASALLWPTTALGQMDGVRRETETREEPIPEPTLTKPPQLLQAGTPEYPPEALARGLEAEVAVRIDIDATGAVTDVQVVEPVGNGFDEAAIAAARQYLFEPAEFDGVPGPITVETTIYFVVEVQPEDDETDTSAAAGEPKPGEADGQQGASQAGAAGAAPATGAGQAAAEPAPPGHAGPMDQRVSIEGVALERGTRRELTGVIISIAELGLDAVTDAEGRFYVHGVPAGRYTILAQAEGFDRFDRTLELGKDEKVEIRLWLRPRGGNPYETVVEGEDERLEVTKRSIQRRQFTTVPGTFGDPVRVVQALPGVARTPFVLGFLLIRGSNPTDSGVYIDGHEVPLLFHFLGGPSFLNPEFLQEINLYPGGFPVRYGRASGGIVEVKPRPTKSDGVHGSADVDFLDAGGYLRFPIGENMSVAVAGRRSYINLLLPLFVPDNEGESVVVTPVYQDFNARFDWNLGDNGRLSLFFFGSGDRLDVLSEDEDAEQNLALDTEINFFRFIASYKRALVGDLTLNLSTAWGDDDIVFSGGQFENADPRTDLRIEQRTWSTRFSVFGQLGPRLRLDTGLEVASRVTRFDLFLPVFDDIRVFGTPDVDPEELDFSAAGLATSAWVELAADLGHGIKLIPGLRIDGYVLNGEPRGNLDPRLTARWAIDEQWTAKGYAGLFSQEVQPEFFDTRFGNPALGIEHSYHLGLGGEWRPNKLWLVDGEIYYVGRDDLVTLTDETRSRDDGTIDQLFFDNAGEGYTYGLEVLIRREITENFFGWLSYTLSRTEFADRNDPDDPSLAPTQFDQRHVLNTIASYRTNGGWEFGVRYRLASGTPETPVVGSTYNADTGEYEPLLGDRFSSRTKTFNQVDVRAEKTWLYNNWSLSAYLDILNVFNLENVEAIQYDYRFRDREPIMSVPFVPSLGVKGQF